MSGYDYRDLDARDRADEQSGTGPAGYFRDRDWREEDCPTCGAAKGNLCRRNSGTPSIVAHSIPRGS